MLTRAMRCMLTATITQSSVKHGNHRGRRILIGLSNSRDPLLPGSSASLWDTGAPGSQPEFGFGYARLGP